MIDPDSWPVADLWPVVWPAPTVDDLCTMVTKVEQIHVNKRETLLLLDVVLKCSCWNGNIGSANSDT